MRLASTHCSSTYYIHPLCIVLPTEKKYIYMLYIYIYHGMVVVASILYNNIFFLT